jgi:arginase
MAKDIRIIGVRSEIGAGTRGASLGVDAIRIAALNQMSNFFLRYPVEEVETENDLLFRPVDSPYARRITGMVTLYERVSARVAAAMKGGAFPVVLSGDHATAGATIAGIRMARPGTRLGVIWIDAHADLHTPYTTPSGNLHGMGVATAFADDNVDHCIQRPDLETLRQWDGLKQTGGIAPKLGAGDLVYVALRDYEPQESRLIKKYGLPVVSVSELRQTGAGAAADRVRTLLKDCELLYISFDADSLDPQVSRGTGTPVKGGLLAEEAIVFIARLMQHPGTCCLEIAEVNPTLDDRNKMAGTAFAILNQSVQARLMR